MCLVQRRHADTARTRLDGIQAHDPRLQGRISLVAGDITRPDLGLESPSRLKAETTEVFHLAAVYDLEVSRRVGQAVNVEGTRNVLDFAGECARLERLHYVSTCYVSGRHPGVFTEDDLDVGQEFNNHYEETKFLAEVLVQERREGHLPVTIYRPAIVVGDSRTGATGKYDGPYFFIRLLLRQPGIALLPLPGDPHRVRANVVPLDFVVEAMAHLAGMSRSVGRVYQLADVDPPTVAEMLDAVEGAVERRVVRIPVPRTVARAALRHVPGLGSLLEIPPAAVDYFSHPTRYTAENTRRDLEGTGISVPPFTSYVDRLVAFVREHPEIGARAMT